MQLIELIELKIIILIIILHLIGDFILQSNWMSQNKSKSNIALVTHIFIYTLPLMIIGFWYAIINGILHFCIDYFTSRISSKLWAKGDVHNFFVIIGLDQSLHYICLFSTLVLI